MVLSVVLYLAMWFGMTNAGITYEDLLYDQYDDSYDSDGSDAWYDGDGNGSYDGGGNDGWYDGCLLYTSKHIWKSVSSRCFRAGMMWRF